MNMLANIVIIAVIALIAGLCVRKLVLDRKNGCVGCTGNCATCHGCAHAGSPNSAKAKK